MTSINISPAEVTNHYLYGQDTTPADLTNPVVALHSTAEPMEFEITDYMTDGAGRFGKPSQFEIIRWFMEFPPAGPQDRETRIPLDEWAEATGLSTSTRVIQAFYDDGKDNLVDRAYIWNTTWFTIVDATFVIGIDGSRWIEGLKIKPDNEDFNFEGSFVSNAANTLLGLEKSIDPWGIGKTILMKYVGNLINVQRYTQEMLESDSAYISGSFKPFENFAEAFFSTLTQDLFNVGVTRFLDEEGRAIIYGQSLESGIDVNGSGANNFGEYSFVATRAPLLFEAASSKGIHWVGDSEVDNVKGGNKDDFLNGYEGDDILEGRDGADILGGGAGIDTASYESSSLGVKVSLLSGIGVGGDAQGDVLGGIENILGSSERDTLEGDALNNLLQGGGGSDTLFGGDGSDMLIGGSGADTLVAGNLSGLNSRPSTDVLSGGIGTDYLVVTGYRNTVTEIEGGDRKDRLLIHQSVLGIEDDGLGEIPAFALLGGTYGAIATHPDWMDDNLFVAANELDSFRVYTYNPKGLPSSWSANVGEYDLQMLINSPGDAPFIIVYQHYFNTGVLRISVTTQGENPSTFYISISDFQMGDYGIRLEPVLAVISGVTDYPENNFYVPGPGLDDFANINDVLRNESDNFGIDRLTGEGQGGANRAAVALFDGDAANGNASPPPVPTIRIVISGEDDVDKLVGNDVSETIRGNGGNDALFGWGGDDTLDGGDGNDRLVSGAGADHFDGGEGIDTADYAPSKSGISVNMETGVFAGGDAEGDSVFSIERVNGSQHDDSITGDLAANRFTGNGGNDLLNGGSGNDILIGGLGADVLNGGDGDRDVADYRGATEAISLSLATGGTGGEAAGDSFVGIEYVYGSAFDDNISGNDGTNRLVGGDGADVLGGLGGIDYLVGESGNDVMTGGQGADVFVFGQSSGNDVIADFWAGKGRTDRIQFTDGQFANFSALQANAANSAAGVVISVADGSSITLTGVLKAQLHADDFIFG